jgi:ABC-type antimicrobial peptide transport system permease subunit
VQWMVLRESLTMLAVGVGLGLPASLAVTRLIKAQLYQLSPFDPLILLVSVTTIAAVTALAAWIPARRAAGVDPMTALRCD